MNIESVEPNEWSVSFHSENLCGERTYEDILDMYPLLVELSSMIDWRQQLVVLYLNQKHQVRGYSIHGAFRLTRTMIEARLIESLSKTVRCSSIVSCSQTNQLMESYKPLSCISALHRCLGTIFRSDKAEYMDHVVLSKTGLISLNQSVLS